MDNFTQINAELGNRFYFHLTAINSDVTPEEARVLWQDIAEHYNENQRVYHTLQHIQQLFGQFEQIKHHLNEPHIIALALFYHDVIYEPTRLDNELKSAEYALDKLTSYLSTEQCQHIYALILMTANHQLNNLADSEKSHDAAYLLDMDLSILGAPWIKYEKYAQAVRREYSHVTSAEYRVGRTAVLNGLSAHPALYLTEHYHQQLEKQARDNIKREISLLRAS